MAKALQTLTLDIEPLEIVKYQLGKGNLSKFINSLLLVEAGISEIEKDNPLNLKLANAKLMTEITELKKKNKILDEELKKKCKEPEVQKMVFRDD